MEEVGGGATGKEPAIINDPTVLTVISVNLMDRTKRRMGRVD